MVLYILTLLLIPIFIGVRTAVWLRDRYWRMKIAAMQPPPICPCGCARVGKFCAKCGKQQTTAEDEKNYDWIARQIIADDAKAAVWRTANITPKQAWDIECRWRSVEAQEWIAYQECNRVVTANTPPRG